ncbi:MAG TPA: ThiF family adenylyltransferase [Gemmataceae bacterium]|nr:ThiF family adenylyltransferase [Gemmataceae bacterium]
MRELVFADTGFSDLAAHLLNSDLETAAVLFANVVPRGIGARFLVREVCHVPADAYRHRTTLVVELSPAFVAFVTKQAATRGQALVFVHSHPALPDLPDFSLKDDQGEKVLADFLNRRIPNRPHAALVVASGGCRARILGTNEPVRVVQTGKLLQYLFDPTIPGSAHAAFDRQVRAFGVEGQAKLQGLRVGIVGLGGTGTIVAQQLAHLGVRSFLLIDPDKVEESNLNRLVGARREDIGLFKVQVIATHIASSHPEVVTDAVTGSVLRASTAKLMREVDFFFCCTDSHGSRAVLSQLAYQYLIPCIDMGVSITVRDGHVTHITGRVQMLAPGLSCLTCCNLLDPDAIRHDLMTDFERQADPYFLGAHEPQPAVISLNGTLSSLAVTMFLGAVTGIPAHARYQIYNGIAGTLRAATHTSDPNCIVCSSSGALARGDEWPLPARQT